MLGREDLDAVFVVTEGEQHAGLVTEVLSDGFHVFVEKPLGWNHDEAAAVAAVAEKTGRKVMVGFMKRFAPSYVTMKRIISDRDSFGEPLSFYGMFGIGSRQGWFDEQYVKLGGIHYIDLFRFLFGEVAEVSGCKNTQGALVDQLFNMRFEDGRIGGMFFAGLPAWTRHWEELTVTGTMGFVKVENMSRIIYHVDKKQHPSVPRWQLMDEEDHIVTSVSTSSSGGLKDLYHNGYVGEVQHFLACLQDNLDPSSSAADNVKTMDLCDRILGAFHG
jgi:predicted dehydrogenase